MRKSIIDLHHLDGSVATFILEYIFLNSDDPHFKHVFGNREKKFISVMCGKGLHSIGKDIEHSNYDTRSRLMKYMEEKLTSWTPSVGCSRGKDEAILCVNKRDVEFWIAVNENKLL